MKKSTMQYLVNLMNDNIGLNGGEAETDAAYVAARDELAAELNKGKEQKEANQAAYAKIHDVVIEALASAQNPVTAQELADGTGYPKGKIVYGLSHYWSEEIEKIEGKVNTYTLKA